MAQTFRQKRQVLMRLFLGMCTLGALTVVILSGFHLLVGEPLAFGWIVARCAGAYAVIYVLAAIAMMVWPRT